VTDFGRVTKNDHVTKSQLKTVGCIAHCKQRRSQPRLFDVYTGYIIWSFLRTWKHPFGR